MARPLVVVGAGGFGREVLELVDDVNSAAPAAIWDVVGVLDDGPVDSGLLSQLEVTHLGDVEVLAGLDPDVAHVIAIGDTRVRADIDARCREWDRTPATLVHPTAVVGRRSVEIGEGSVLCAYSSVTSNVRLGRHVHLNPHCSVGHDTSIDDHTTVTPHVAVAGAVRIGPRVFVGTGATVGPRITVGEDVLVGAGAVVVRDVAPRTTVAGVPARPR